MEGPFGAHPGGSRFRSCSTPMSIRSIEILYESGPRPLIWSLQVGQEYNGYKATTTFGDDMRAVNFERGKVCL